MIAIKTLDIGRVNGYNNIENRGFMEKDLNFSELFSEYKVLLTKNQCEVFDLYYLCDLSLGEISEIKGISRQGVSDNLSKTRELLISYEKNLGLLAKKRKMLEIANKLEDCEEKTKLLKIIGDL